MHEERRFDQEDAAEIVRRAARLDAVDGPVSRTDLLAAATEAGVSREALERTLLEEPLAPDEVAGRLMALPGCQGSPKVLGSTVKARFDVGMDVATVLVECGRPNPKFAIRRGGGVAFLAMLLLLSGPVPWFLFGVNSVWLGVWLAALAATVTAMSVATRRAAERLRRHISKALDLSQGSAEWR